MIHFDSQKDNCRINNSMGYGYDYMYIKEINNLALTNSLRKININEFEIQFNTTEAYNIQVTRIKSILHRIPQIKEILN
jgi:hypothetical protein